MKIRTIVCLFVSIQACTVNCLIEPISWTAAGIYAGVVGIASYGYTKWYPDQCYSEKYVTKRGDWLEDALKLEIQGQHIAIPIIANAIKKHWKNPNPVKPLVMIFHGPTGTGKNFASTWIARAMFEEGESSDYYHFFNGRVDFPSNGFTHVLQNKLKDEVQKALETCENSLFVFDEVDDMAEGVLNILVPFLDYSEHGFLRKKVKKNKAIYLFLTNAASHVVVDEMLRLWKSGKTRESLTIFDFERLMEKGIFNQKGGLRGSDTISTSLIDHYAPFLPLEESHVVHCIRKAYRKIHKEQPTKEFVKYILRSLTFGPEGANLYSEAGCKRVESLVSVYS